MRICDEEWNVYRRYAQFYVLHKSLKKQYPVIGTFFFPPKKTLGNKVVLPTCLNIFMPLAEDTRNKLNTATYIFKKI